jgi:hypothetical protein
MMLRRQICERAVFDYSADDPRFLVFRYQQKVRAQLLAKAAEEERRKGWMSHVARLLASSAAELARAIVNPRQAPQRAAVPRLRLVPSTQVSF